MYAKEISADTQRPQKDDFEILVHYFSVGVWTSVQYAKRKIDKSVKNRDEMFENGAF